MSILAPNFYVELSVCWELLNVPYDANVHLVAEFISVYNFTHLLWWVYYKKYM
jgi:hypothetical protein